MQRGQIDDPKLSAALRNLELTVKRNLDGVLHGDHHGLIPGPGSEPGESREYQPLPNPFLVMATQNPIEHEGDYPLPEALRDRFLRVVTATRHPEQLGMNDVKSWISFGASPRASLGIIAASRSLALARGRDYVIPQDVVEVIPDVLRHRLVLTYDALADEISSETVINRILQTVGLPQVNAIPQQGHSVPPVMPAAAAAASGR